MNIPLSLYDYLALFVPGTLILAGLAPALQITTTDLRSATTLEIVVLAVLAFVAGHFNQWVTKAMLVAQSQFVPWWGNTTAYLLRQPYPTPPPALPLPLGRRILGALKAIFPFYWSMQQLSKDRADRIAMALNAYCGHPVRPEEAMGRILSALEQAGYKDVLARRDQFQAQADFLRGTATSLILFAVCTLVWGPPSFLVPHKLSPLSVGLLALGLVTVAAAFIKRYLQYEFNTASMLFTSFETLVRHRSGSTAS